MTDYSKPVEALRCCIPNPPETCEGCTYNTDVGCNVARMMSDAADAIEALQAQLPKHGEWVRVEDGESYHYECSRCGERPLYSRYGDVVLSGACPMCGAEMNDSNASNALNALDNAQDGPIVTPCRGCSDYDGYGGCKSKGGCARAKMEVQE